MYTVKVIELFVRDNEVLSYIFLLLGALIEGEFILITSGILAHLGALPLLNVFVVATTGAMIKPFVGYWFGGIILKYFPNSRFLHFLEKRIVAILPRIKTQPFWSVFISKFVYGVNHLTLIFAGFLKLPFKKFIIAEFTSTIIWLTGLISLGYFFSHTAFALSRDIKKVSVILLLCIIGFLLVQKIIVFFINLYESYAEEKEHEHDDQILK